MAADACGWSREHRTARSTSTKDSRSCGDDGRAESESANQCNDTILEYHLAMPARKADARTYPTITRAEAEAWRDLHRQLAKTRTLQDVQDIAAQAAPPHATRFYAHLRSFVRTLEPPRRGTRSELHVYRALRLRFANRRWLPGRQTDTGDL